MAKGKNGKKKNYRLRKQLRRTFGCLFMISAMIVAAVPVQSTEAKIEEAASKVVVINQTKGLEDYENVPAGFTGSAYKSKVPYVDPASTIYTTGDGQFHFAYIIPTKTSADRVAVILGYTNIGELESNALTVPDTVDAYRKYSTNTTVGEACAVSRNNEFLFYPVEKKVQKLDPVSGEPLYNQTAPALMQSSIYNALTPDEKKKYTITSGNPATDANIYTTVTNYDDPVMETKTVYEPCYYSSRGSWDKDSAGNKIFKESELYYRQTDTSGNLVTDGDGNYIYLQTNDDQEHQRIHDAVVAYIGNQKVVAKADGEWGVGPYVTPATPDNGIFAGVNNIVSLTLGKNLMGIGDYAFYSCRGLGKVNLSNALDTIGNGAFAGCLNLITCNIEKTANLKAIGKDAFYGCVALTDFVIPTGLEAIGDSCFENCRSLATIDLGDGRNVAFNKLGNYVFKGCESLKGVSFPRDYTETLEIQKVFDGCTSLKYVKAPNALFTFKDETQNINAFKAMVGEDFYFEASDISPLHTLATKYGIAFKYLDQDIYEKVVISYGSDGKESGRTTWKVNSKNELIDFTQTGIVNDLEVPDQIGPYHIVTIRDRAFSGNCDLEKITIPSSVTGIGAEAFLGCHNLKDVIFQEPINLTSIGTDAFSTQKGVNVHTKSCATGALAAVPELTFSGTVDPASLPFKYAMMPSSTINYGSQPKTWIKFYSGWPSNLTVQYNPDTGKSELTDYPRYSDLKNYSLTSYPYMTQEYVDAAKDATDVYEKYNSGASTTKPTENQEAIVNSALNIVLPSGITGLKAGVFSGVDSEGKAVNGITANTNVLSVTTNTVDEIPSYGFAGCISLERFYMGGGTGVGSYAFDGDKNLSTVEIPASVTSLGLRPFRGCINVDATSGAVTGGLTNVTFKDGGSFTCSNGIIYKVTGGKNTGIIECLETRGRMADVISGVVGPEELADVTEIVEEAFKDCVGIGEVNLSSSSVKAIPEKCFMNTKSLYKVTLPDSCLEIENGAFWNSFLGSIIVPSSVKRIAPDAFSETDDDGATFKPHDQHKTIDVICLDDSDAAFYSKDYSYMNPKESDDLKARFNVTFYTIVDDVTERLGDPVKVISGEDAELPLLPEIDGYVFEKWLPGEEAAKNIVKDTELWAVYKVRDAETFTVQFINWDDEILDTQTVEKGKNAITPSITPEKEGYDFAGWRGDYNNVQENLKIYATFEKKDPDESKFTITFYSDSTAISTQRLAAGEAAVTPTSPTKEGYKFDGWLPSSGWENVQKDMDIYAKFVADTGGGGGIDGKFTITFYSDSTVISTQQVAKGEAAQTPASPTKTGYKFNGWLPSSGWENVQKDMDIYAQFVADSGGGGNNNGGNNNGGNNNGTNNNSSSSSGNSVSGNSTKYKVTVNGGSGSGDYTPGTIVSINAYFTSDGKTFDKWTSSSGGVGFVNASAASTNFTMPSNNVDITATFKTGGSSSVSGNGRNTLRNSTTSVDVTKGGISNTELAAANVNGSSDNYSVRITEDASATAAVIAALEAKYGDLSNIAYLPMDISLYNAAGDKVTTAGGVTVDITLPLPDELAGYAGNNHAGSVNNGALEELNKKFTTIDGIPCIQFTATHFSPYVIYVDKGNLTEGTVDATPKTGDPIHPKWFLAIGLACISVILFCKKDRMKSKVKTA